MNKQLARNQYNRSILGKMSDWREFSLVAVIFVMCVVFSISSSYFLRTSNWVNIGLQGAIVIIISFGMNFVILSGGIDLSVGSILALSSVLAPKIMLSGMPIWLASLVALGAGTLAGMINGTLIVKTGINPFLVTLGTSSVLRGITYHITGGSTVPVVVVKFLDLFAGEVLGIPLPIIYAVLLFVMSHVVLSKMKFGREVYATGSNDVAARLSGIKVDRVRSLVYTIAGFLAGFGGLIAAARFGSGLPSYGEGLELEAIAAVVLGGTSFDGGSGTMTGTILGALLMVILINGLTLLNVSYYTQMVVKGTIIILAVYWDIVQSRK